VGDIVDFSPQDARLLLAEQWATDRERRRGKQQLVRVDRRRKPSDELIPGDEGGEPSQD